MEAVYHALGVCGEHSHPSVLTLLASGVASLPFISYIKSYVIVIKNKLWK